MSPDLLVFSLTKGLSNPAETKSYCMHGLLSQYLQHTLDIKRRKTFTPDLSGAPLVPTAATRCGLDTSTHSLAEK
jgi:hypothetical protein